jgi:hypothetical protein
MAEIIFKIKGQKVGKFKAKLCKVEKGKGILRDGRVVKRGKNGQWIYEAK